MAAQLCPICGLFCTGEARRCDCGFLFDHPQRGAIAHALRELYLRYAIGGIIVGCASIVLFFQLAAAGMDVENVWYVAVRVVVVSASASVVGAGLWIRTLRARRAVDAE